MSEPLWLERLAAASRQEAAPPVDVVGAVLHRLRRVEEFPARELRIVAGVAIPLSVLATIATASMWATLADPLVQWLAPLALGFP